MPQSPKLRTFEQWVLPFLVGAVVVGGTTILADQVSNTKWAAIAWSFPFSMIPTLIILYVLNKDSDPKEGTRKLTALTGESLPSMFPLVFFLLTFWLLMRYDALSFWWSLLCALGAWLIGAVIMFLTVCPSPFDGGKCINLGRL